MNDKPWQWAAVVGVAGRHVRHACARGATRAGVVVAVVLASWCVSRCAVCAPPVDERHGFAIGRKAVPDAVKGGDAAATVAMRCRCPVDGEYAVVVLYDGTLAGIDAMGPQVRRPFAAPVSAAMGVGLSATVTDANTGEDVVPKAIAPTVFDAATKGRKWSGERLAVFQLRGGGEYRLVVDMKGPSPAWLSLNPVVLLDPSAEVAKSLAWRAKGPRP